MSLDLLLNRLPSLFEKESDSNNYKAFTLIANQFKDSEELYATILRFWDVDQAEGVGLDRLGKDEGISRGSYDDETYRKLIKIEYIVNMSTGDIEVMNTILDAYMGENFLGLEEGWTKYLGEPASLIANVDVVDSNFPFRLLQRIKPVGVGISVATQRYIDLGLNIGGAYSNYQSTHISPPAFEMTDLNASINQGFVIAKYDVFDIGLPLFEMEDSTELAIHYGALVAKYDTTHIDLPPFTIADARISKSYGGAFSYWQQTTILSKGAM